MKNHRAIWAIFILLVVFVVHAMAFFLIKEHGMIMDEHEHFRQIVRVINGTFKPDPNLPMTPGYHFTVGYIARILGWNTYSSVRLISFLLNFLTIPVFFLIARGIDKNSATLRMLQYSLLPILFPFYPLLYTDIFSLLLILISLLLVIQKRYVLSAVVSGISILVRQNNLVWVGLFNMMIYVAQYGFILKKEYIREHIRKTYAFLLGPFVFAGFYIINGGIAVGSASRQFVFISLAHPGNVFFGLFLFFLLFLPVVLSYGKKIIGFISRYKIYMLFAFSLYPYYVLMFVNRHPFNGPGTTFFLRNALLTYFGQDVFHQVVFFVISLISLIGLICIKLEKKEFYLLYPATLVILLPVWLIEQRYLTVPFTLFLLFRKRRSSWVEYALTFIFLVLSVYLYNGIFNWNFFL